MPAGSEPDLSDHVTGAVPPLDASEAVYPSPLVAGGSEVVVMFKGAAAGGGSGLEAALDAGPDPAPPQPMETPNSNVAAHPANTTVHFVPSVADVVIALG
ncbi:MAG: hypothetical protein ACRD1C_10670 [Terriglobales bacterium]